MKKIITLSSLILFPILPTLSWGDSNRIEGKYLCHQIFGYDNYYDKTDLRKEHREKSVKIEIFEDKVISKTKFVYSIKDKEPIIDVEEYVFQRPKNNIGNKEVEGFNNIGRKITIGESIKMGLRTLNFKNNTLTYVIMSSPLVWVYSYKCELDY